MEESHPQDQEMTLAERWPQVYEHLCEVRRILEKNYRDVCDFEFTVQNGKLYVLNVRTARRTPEANLRFALQFFQEGKIGLSEAVSRVSPEDVESLVRPIIVNESELVPLGTGLPVCCGAATGRLAVSRERAEEFRRRSDPFVFARVEVSPEDIDAMYSSAGVLTARGGMTSHAAVVCRGMHKPCVVGLGEMVLSYRTGQLSLPDNRLYQEGAWITLNGSTGEVYGGEAKLISGDWQEIPELRMLGQMIEQAIVSDGLDQGSVGSTWRIRDFFIHSVPLRRTRTNKRPVSGRSYTSFVPPRAEELDAGRKALHPIPLSEREDYSQVLLGLSETLSRLLASELGLGNHHKYFRPLWDPEVTVRPGTDEEQTQFLAFQYFDVNRYVHHLPEISDFLFLLEVELRSEEDKWFLDFTNPNGESLVVNSDVVLGANLFVNAASVQHCDIPILYNVLRRREYYWRWFEYNKTSHEELAEFLRQGTYMSQPDSRLALYCEELGLIREGELTLAGLSMIGKLEKARRYGFLPE